jgi:hypothetical protein
MKHPKQIKLSVFIIYKYIDFKTIKKYLFNISFLKKMKAKNLLFKDELYFF